MRQTIAIGMAAVFALLSADAADARHRHRSSATHNTSTGLAVDSSGTPIIMQDYPASRSYQAGKADQASKGRRGSQVVPRISGPITVPPPHTGLPNLPAREQLQFSPPPILAAPTPSRPSFSDRVTNCIHSYPLNAGIGNNPTDRTAYMGQCVNQ